MRRTALAALLVFAGWLFVAASLVTAGSDAGEEVLAAQHAVAEAITHQDYDKLDKLLSQEQRGND